MDRNPIINVLVLADLLPEGEQLVSTMRKAGFSVHAEAVRDQRWLRERLISHGWDVLLIRADNTRISAPRLAAVLTEIKPDLLCLTIGSTAATECLQTCIAQVLIVPGISDLNDPRQSSLLLRTLTRELHNLQIHRQLRRSNAALKELQGRHQLLLDNTSDAMAYLHDGMHVYVNGAYASLFGHTDPATLLNTAFLDLVDESVVEEARQILRQEIDSQDSPTQDQHRLRALDATGLPLELWLHCGNIVYHNEQTLQVILRPVHGSSFRQATRSSHVLNPHVASQTSTQQSPDRPSPDPKETQADTPDGFLPEIQRSDDSILQQRLQLALETDDFELLFQPVAGFTEDGVEHYAVSIRLRDDDAISPARLLATASCFGLGERVDRLVLSHCLHLLREADRPGLRLVVNLTHDSMMHPGFLPWLQQQLQESQVQSEHLVLQLSELDIVGTPPEQVEEFCRQLRELQTPLAVTHFGGSLDPFSYLPRQHATYVELDQSLVDSIDSDSSKLSRLQDTVSRLQASGLLIVSRVDKMELLPALWEARINFVRGDCLQKAGIHMDFAFVRDEEATLAALH